MNSTSKNETDEIFMDNENKIILTGHPTPPTQRPPLPPKPQASYCDDEYSFLGFSDYFKEIKNLVKSLFKGSRKQENEGEQQS